jgi:GAF domain-containing protein
VFFALTPLVTVAIYVWAYRLSARHWYLAVYFYLSVTIALIGMWLYVFGGAQGPMGMFFIWTVLIAGMLIDLRAGLEVALVSIFLYGLFAVGELMGWLTLPLSLYTSVSAYLFPLLSVMMFFLMALLARLFGGSLNTAVERARQLAAHLEEQMRQRQDMSLQLEDKNRRLVALAESQQRRAAQLQLAAEVSRAITQVVEPEELLVRVVDLIRERFDFYYVGLFLLDEAGRQAVLRAGTGEAGRIMLERQHRLEAGGLSMVGWVSANRKARIALDVGQEAARFANPLLPDTHSEMALPLLVGERVLGVLDVQSRLESAFSEEDVTVLQGVADQVGVALENARLFQQTRAALTQLEATNRLMVRQSWQSYTGRAGARRAVHQPGGEPAQEVEPLALPLELRGEQIGRVLVRRAGAWTREELDTLQAIVTQTALAADNARLFEESQRLASRERAINEITARIRGSVTLEGILNSAIREISQATGAQYAAIKLELAETSGSKAVEASGAQVA